MVLDQQEPVYLDHFKPYAIDIVEMQLTGLPIDIERTKEVNAMVAKMYDDALRIVQNSPIVSRFEAILAQAWADKKNAEYKKKRVTAADWPEKFNPNSGLQLQGLLFDMLQMPVISLTKTKQPSTDADTIKALLNHTKDPDILAFLRAIQEVSLYSTLLNTFLPAMLGAQQGSDGWYYLFGSYNLGGAISGRLSSSDPRPNWGH
jgi:DNA polymerase-1